MEKRYNLLTAISLVVGIVVGSGVFFKSSTVLAALEGNLPLSILAWVLGGVIMIISAYTFSLIATKTKNGEIIEMAEVTAGRKHAYIINWYFGIIYFPIICAVISWVAAMFTLTLFDIEMNIYNSGLLGLGYMLGIFVLNYLAPKIAGKFQISTTIVKLVPLILMGIGGTVYGLFFKEGTLIDNLTEMNFFSGKGGFFAALTATAFAYEGWIIATSIAKELKNAKKNLPIALVFGTIIILVIYLVYYIGLAGIFPNNDYITNGDSQVKAAFIKLFHSNLFGSLLYVFIVVSVIGTLNGVMMGVTRTLKSIAETNNGPKPEKIKKITKKGMSPYSSFIGLGLTLFWFIIWLLIIFKGAFGGAGIDELVIVLTYSLYIPIYINIIRKRTDLNIFNRFIAPILAIIASIIMIVAGFVAHGWANVIFIVFVGIIILIGLIFYRKETPSIN